MELLTVFQNICAIALLSAMMAGLFQLKSHLRTRR